MSMDDKTTVQQLKQQIEDFVNERDWAQFHSPKNLAMALAVEAAELMDLFKWFTLEESREQIKESLRADVADELADIMIYAMAFANRHDLDIAAVVTEKMTKNRVKYPAEKFQGHF